MNIELIATRTLDSLRAEGDALNPDDFADAAQIIMINDLDLDAADHAYDSDTLNLVADTMIDLMR